MEIQLKGKDLCADAVTIRRCDLLKGVSLLCDQDLGKGIGAILSRSKGDGLVILVFSCKFSGDLKGGAGQRLRATLTLLDDREPSGLIRYRKGIGILAILHLTCLKFVSFRSIAKDLGFSVGFQGKGTCSIPGAVAVGGFRLFQSIFLANDELAG